MDVLELTKDLGIVALSLVAGAAGHWAKGRAARRMAQDKAEREAQKAARDREAERDKQIREDSGRFALVQAEAQPKIIEEMFDRVNELEMQLAALHREHVKLTGRNARLQAENKYLRGWTTTIPNMPAHRDEDQDDDDEEPTPES